MVAKKFREIYPGQIFEIYLQQINKYAYGVVLAGDIRLDKNDDIIIGYIESFTEQPINLEEVIKNIEKRNFSFIANSGIASIYNHCWTFVGSYQKMIMGSDELNKVEYAAEFMDKFYRSVGNSLLPISDCEKIKKEEFKKIPNPLGLVGDIAIENRLIDIASNQL
ncbi:hypothetical protein [Bacillus cihuensis]|uniref:hypothetical protein n=1 Tax=Bacillus cihuensis TaxID=1208599 RepID=UPI00040AC5E9|nr:hypothetical protein [Bacillus cihuensis]